MFLFNAIERENGIFRWKYVMPFLLMVGIVIRLAAIGTYPVGIHQDEAYSGYEAFCLLSTGTDSWCDPFPVYLTTWGSGMNALQTYLLMPLVSLFGLEKWVLRLPQALLACISLPAAYLLLRRLFSEKTARIGLAFLVICPWHITLARWGLESNLAPGMVLLGFLFFMKGLEKPVYFLGSGLMYGLSLYAYATIWPVLPFLILFHVLYLIYVRKLNFSVWLMAGAAILGMLALPLILFLAVNWGIIDEIRTPWMTIPKMHHMRTDDLSLSNLYPNVYRLVKTFLLQRDDRVWHASDEFGLYYHISLPFIAIGACSCLADTVKSMKKRTFSGAVMIMIWLLLGALLGCTFDGNVTRFNFMHFPMVFCAVIGIRNVCKWLGKRFNQVGAMLAAVYGICFVLFVGFYFTEYQEKLKPQFNAGLEEALAFARQVTAEDEIIHVSDRISHPKILFYDRMDPEVFQNTVEWRGNMSAYMMIDAAGRYRFDADAGYDQSGVYVVVCSHMNDEIPDGYDVAFYDQIAVVYPADQ